MTAEPLKPCPFCDHAWSRHDPEDGKCDAGPPCQCGRDLKWMQRQIARLSRMELDSRSLNENTAPRSAPSEGWQTVPLEWTPEMRDAYNTVCKSAKDLHHAWFVKKGSKHTGTRRRVCPEKLQMTHHSCLLAVLLAFGLALGIAWVVI